MVTFEFECTRDNVPEVQEERCLRIKEKRGRPI